MLLLNNLLCSSLALDIVVNWLIIVCFVPRVSLYCTGIVESFDLVIVCFAGYAVLLIVLCFEAYIYIRITGTGVCFIGRSVSCPHICFFVGVSAKGRIWYIVGVCLHGC